MLHALKTFGLVKFLASVRSAEEARLALKGGADIIDCKEPDNGALGALTGEEITSVVKAVDGRALVSATIGDLPTDAVIMVKGAKTVAATGVDIVKVGFFETAGAAQVIAALGAADLNGARLVAVLMADRPLDLKIIETLTAAGFLGVMVDTADKSRGRLGAVMTAQDIGAFIEAARRQALVVGLAGSLAVSDIASMVAFQPDIIGFRGALCETGRRGALSLARVEDVRAGLNAALSASMEIIS